jgi:hypothetical protein
MDFLPRWTVMDRRPLLAATAVAACAIGVAAAWPAAAATSSPARAKASAAPPQPVTGLTFLLNVMDAGNKVGIPEVYGLAVSAVSVNLPTPASDPALAPASAAVEHTLSAAKPPLDQMTAAGSQGIAQLRSVISPLSVLNQPANAAIEGVSASIVTGVTVLRPLIQPFDVNALQVAQFLKQMESPAP